MCHKIDELCEFEQSFTRERTSDLFVGVNIFDRDSWVQVFSITQPLKVNTMIAENMSNGWCATALDDHLDHGVIVLKK